MRGLRINFFRGGGDVDEVRLADGKAGERNANLDADIEDYLAFLRKGETKGRRLPRVSSFVLADYVDQAAKGSVSKLP